MNCNCKPVVADFKIVNMNLNEVKNFTLQKMEKFPGYKMETGNFMVYIM